MSTKQYDWDVVMPLEGPKVQEELYFGVVHLPKAPNTLFPPVHGSVGSSNQLWLFFSLSISPSVCPERLPGISQRTHGGNGLIFCMLIHTDHLQNWFYYCHGLLIFILLAPLWVKWITFVFSRHFPETTWKEWPAILRPDVSRLPLELVRLWSRSLEFSNCGTILT